MKARNQRVWGSPIHLCADAPVLGFGHASGRRVLENAESGGGPDRDHLNFVLPRYCVAGQLQDGQRYPYWCSPGKASKLRRGNTVGSEGIWGFTGL